MLRKTGAEYLQPGREGQVIVIGRRLLMPGADEEGTLSPQGSGPRLREYSRLPEARRACCENAAPVQARDWLDSRLFKFIETGSMPIGDLV